ncbi:MAG: hypothetical protein RL582_1415 [Bacteroidota bacterium]|jgi:GLPGLI family protein
MRRILVLLIAISTKTAFSQTAILNKAIIYTNMNVIAPEEESAGDGDGGGRQGMNFRNMMDGETKIITSILNEKVKTDLRSESIKSSMYRDENKKLTTTVFEMMGNTSGFYATDEEQAAMQARRDSMMAEIIKKDSLAPQRMEREKKTPVTNFVSTTETKKIAGYNCYKGYLITDKILGLKDTVSVWYTPEFTFQNVKFTGGISGIQGMMGNTSLVGADKVNGFIMAYELKMRRNRKMVVEVTKIDIKKDITEKDFEIPKDIEIKPMKEMQSMFGNQRGGGMMRMNRE